jgi:hypothetical protein
MTATQDRPPSPPQPAPFNGDQRAIADQLAQLRRAKRDAQRATWGQRLRSVNHAYWRALSVLVALALVAWWFRSYQADQRATDLQIAALAAGPTVTSEPPPSDPFPNPLNGLSNQAAWVIGIDERGELNAKRSSFVVTELLKLLDLCGTYVGLDASGTLFVSPEPVSGSFPILVDGCDAAPVPAPPTTVGGA